MEEMAEGYDRSTSQSRSPAAWSSPLSSPGHCSIQTQLPVEPPPRPPWMSDQQTEQEENHRTGMRTSELPLCCFYEELYCSSQASVSLASALINSSGPQSDVVKQGYLGKLDRNHRRYFVLRAGSHTGPSRLEWYKSQEKFTAMEKSSGKAMLFGSNKQGAIYLRCCLGVSRTGSSRKGHTVAVFAKDQTMVLVAEDQQEQDGWYLAVKRLMDEEQREEDHGGTFDEDDDGYCTLPPAAFFKEVWAVSVKPKGLGRSRSFTGEARLCLAATSVVLVRVGTCRDLPSVTIPLLSVRRFGHLDGSFFVELGRTAPDGPGEIWMEAKDQSNQRSPETAQHIHEAVRETVRALRAFPDFSRSPISNHNRPQALLLSKRSRPKNRDKLVNVRQRTSVPASRNTDVDISPQSDSALSLTPRLRAQQGTEPTTGSYMEMKMEQCGVAACRMEDWELGEEEEVLGYMMMSPQVSCSSSGHPVDDYVTMASPRKHWCPPYSPSSSITETSFNSSTSDLCPPVHQPHWHVASEQQSTMEAGQSQMSSSQPVDDAGQEQTSVQQGRRPVLAGATSPIRTIGGSDLTPPFATSRPSYTRPVQASPNSGPRPFTLPQAPPNQSAARRHRLSAFLPSCLQAKDRS